MNLSKESINQNRYAEVFGSANEAQKRSIEEAIKLEELLVFESCDEIIIEGDHPLAERSAKMLQDVYGVKKGVKINMDNICYDNGCALCLAVLDGLNKLWNLNRPVEKLVQLTSIIRGA